MLIPRTRNRWGDAILVVSAWCQLCATATSLKLRGWRPRPELLELPANDAQPAPAQALRISRLVDHAAHLSPWRITCLVRSLCKVRMLRAAGMPAVLRLGARVDDGELHAHAWAEVAGQALDGGGICAQYAVLERRQP